MQVLDHSSFFRSQGKLKELTASELGEVFPILERGEKFDCALCTFSLRTGNFGSVHKQIENCWQHSQQGRQTCNVSPPVLVPSDKGMIFCNNSLPLSNVCLFMTKRSCRTTCTDSLFLTCLIFNRLQQEEQLQCTHFSLIWGLPHAEHIQVLEDPLIMHSHNSPHLILWVDLQSSHLQRWLDLVNNCWLTLEVSTHAQLVRDCPQVCEHCWW